VEEGSNGSWRNWKNQGSINTYGKPEYLACGAQVADGGWSGGDDWFGIEEIRIAFCKMNDWNTHITYTLADNAFDPDENDWGSPMYYCPSGEYSQGFDGNMPGSSNGYFMNGAQVRYEGS
jgi:hypothetical protein